MSIPQLRKRPANASKRDFGRNLVIAGSYGMAGAACLTAEACYRSGAGVVYLLTPEKIYDVVATKLTTSVIIPVHSAKSETLTPSAILQALEFSKRCNVCAIGPGIGQNKKLADFVNQFVAKVTIPTVIDADGLNNLKATTVKRAKTSLVLTPHEGEFARLTGEDTIKIQENRAFMAKEWANELKCCIVLKGHKTVVTNGSEAFINQTGNPGMATGGSGDVLTGIISALIGQGYSTLDAAKLGVYLHGIAGDLAAKELTQYSMTAEDIITFLPRAFKKHLGLWGL